MRRLLFIHIILLLSIAVKTQSVDEQINHLISQMTTEEKIAQLTSNTFFTTSDNARLGIPGFQMSDGPHGVRFGGASVFPVGIAQAASWDVELIERLGKAMGNEFWEKGKHQQLGPCLDLCRDPRNGRSPETLGEDPYLAGEIGKAVVKGIQQSPVVATAKHFNLVNKQQYRYNSNITISDRWLMEHYGHDFREVVQEASVLSVMNAYNLINGIHCSQNHHLMQTILRERWGFPFYIVSDWGAVHNTKYAIEAGTDICMGSSHYATDLPGLINSGSVSMNVLNKAVYRVLITKLMNGMLDNYPRCTEDYINTPDHNELVLESGRKSLILLKNEDQILPLDEDIINKVALIGPSANVAQLDGFGSSWVDPVYTVTPRQGIENIIGSEKVIYTHGCDINSNDVSGFDEALNAAAEADVVIFVGGLDYTQEGEGFGDRPEYDRAGGSIDLPGKQQDLINELASVNDNIIVVLKSGGICGVNNSIDNIKGFIYAFYPGHEGGNAIAEALFGLYNPGGRLPVSMPKTDSQLPPWNDNFNDDFGCGYRWFDENNIIPEYPFGYGLSYTEFSYSNIQLSSAVVDKGQPVDISVTVTNTGSRAGDEVVQLYLSDINSSIWMPEKQLKGFTRIHLLPAESSVVTFTLSAEDFYYWNEIENEYQIEAGAFNIKLGGSSDNLPLEASIEVLESGNKPDLEISNILSLPKYPLTGDSVRLLATLKNTGTNSIDYGDPVSIDFMVENQVVVSLFADTIVIPIGGMLMLEAVGEYWVPADSGSYEVKAQVDGDNQINEILENNNIYSKIIKVYDAMDPMFIENIALFKPVTATSVESEDYKAEFGVDGIYSTRWSSEFFDPQEFTIYLKGIYDIYNLRIHWEAAYSSVYEVSFSIDSIDWETLIYENEGDGGVDQFDINVEARYIKFTGLQRATEWGHSFYEFEAFGDLIEADPNTIFEGVSKNSISIYPNPAYDQIYVSGLEEYSDLEIRIINPLGQVLKEIHTAHTGSIDIKDLHPGIYYLTVKHGREYNSVPFVKMTK